MKDLKAELDLLQQTTAYKWGEDDALIAEEAIRRAIESEELVELLQNGIQKMIDQDVEWHCEFAALREENDIKRASIQNLSAQVVRLRKALKIAELFIRNGIEFGYIRMPDPENADIASQVPDMIAKILSQPDPGADIREHMAKLEAVAAAAQEILTVKVDNYSWLKLWSNLSLALGDRP